MATASWLRPHVETLIWRTRRAEAELTLDHLRAFFHANPSALEMPFVDVPQTKGQVGVHRVPWSAARLPPGWKPPTRTVRCTYSKEADDGDITLRAECDVDGDGRRAVFIATPERPVRRVSPADVY